MCCRLMTACPGSRYINIDIATVWSVPGYVKEEASQLLSAQGGRRTSTSAGPREGSRESNARTGGFQSDTPQIAGWKRCRRGARRAGDRLRDLPAEVTPDTSEGEAVLAALEHMAARWWEGSSILVEGKLAVAYDGENPLSESTRRFMDDVIEARGWRWSTQDPAGAERLSPPIAGLPAQGPDGAASDIRREAMASRGRLRGGHGGLVVAASVDGFRG